MENHEKSVLLAVIPALPFDVTGPRTQLLRHRIHVWNICLYNWPIGFSEMFFPHHLRLATTASTVAVMALLATTVSGAAVRASHGTAGYNRFRCSTLAMLALVHEIFKYKHQSGLPWIPQKRRHPSMLLRGYEDEQQPSEFAVGDKKSHGGTGNDASTLHQHRTLQEPHAKIELVNGNSSRSSNRRFFLLQQFPKKKYTPKN